MARRVRISAAAAAVAAAMSIIAGCFDAPEPACGFACGEGGACPPSYQCAPDGWCKRADVDQNTSCGARVLDAAIPDAGAPDGGDVPDGGEAADAGATDDADSSSRHESWF